MCFAFARASIFIALDEKPKEVPVTHLKRVRNILENPEVALIADRYAEDWGLLAFVMVRGRAELLEPDTEEHAAAVRLLRGKYHQYEAMRIEENPVIAIRPERAVSWGSLDEPEAPGAAGTRHDPRPPLGAAVSPKRCRRISWSRYSRPARWAPSPHGRQPWRFAVLTQEETKERLADAMGEEWRANLEMDGQSAEIVERRLEGSRRRLLDAPVLVLCACTSKTSTNILTRSASAARPRWPYSRWVPRPRTRCSRPTTRPRRGLDVRPALLPGEGGRGAGARPEARPARPAHAGIR